MSQTCAAVAPSNGSVVRPCASVASCESARETAERVLARFDAPEYAVAALILTTLLARVVFAAALGLGVDESYMVAAGRTLQLSYFDHPPLAWWMAWSAAHLAGSDAAIAVRSPFVLVFALTTWLMFRLTSRLFGARAGLWAAVLLNIAPVFGITTGSWVLPDGPLMAALLGAAVCLSAALSAQRWAAWGWWLGAGVGSGLALLSKYSAILTIGGAVILLVTQPTTRSWLRRPHPYAAVLLAFVIFLPVLVWNAEHGWTSLLFQGGRVGGSKLHVFGPVSTLAGEALFLLPWVWLPLVACGIAAVRAGPADPARWLLVCLAAPPIVFFCVISLRTHVLFHWAAPGYLMLFPLLGEAVSRAIRGSRGVRLWLAATAITVGAGAAFAASEVRFDWLYYVGENFTLGHDPDLDAVDWIALKTDLRARGLLDRPGLVVAATRWHDAGKIDYALGGAVTVICLGADPREYGLIARVDDYFGDDALIVAPRMTLAQVTAKFGPSFDSIEALPATVVQHAGRPAMLLPLFLGHRLHRRADQPT